MSAIVEDRNELREQYTLLAPIVSRWLRAFVECSDTVQGVICEMFEIINDPETDDDDKKMASRTLVEALFPKSFNGSLGADLVELENEHRTNGEGGSKIISEMDAEEQTFASKVTTLMEQRGMTQTQLAEAIGVGQSAISMMLSRQARPQRRTVTKIAEALGVEVEELWPSASK